MLPSILKSRNDILCLSLSLYLSLFAARLHEKLAKTRRKGTRVNWEALTVNQPRMQVKELEKSRDQVNLRRKNWTYTLVEEYATSLIWFSPGIRRELVKTKPLLQSDYFRGNGFEYSPDECRYITTNCATRSIPSTAFLLYYFVM